LDMQRLMGLTREKGKFNIVWPSLAAWASNSVGVSIRKELPSGWFESITQGLPKELVKLLLLFPKLVYKLIVSSGLLDQTSYQLGIANKAIFLEVGTAFAQCGVYFLNLTTPDNNRVRLYNKTFCPDRICQIVKEGMYWYYRATFEPDLKLQVEYTCAANAQIGNAEQTRLSPYITKSLFHANFTFSAFGFNFNISAENLITKYMICLVYPNEFFDAGYDVTPYQGHNWPQQLISFNSTEVQNLYLTFINQTTSLKGTAAHNWDLLNERLRFIVPLFRSRQQDDYVVTCPPFTPAQTKMILSGIKPDSKDLCLSANCCDRTRPN